MNQILKKVLLTIIFNSSLFLMIIIGSQNSTNKKTVNLLIDKTVSLPIGFIIGTSFISGSIIGSALSIYFDKEVN